jgi:hypothetical protein
VTRATLAAEPALPTTRAAPRALAIWPARLPTAPGRPGHEHRLAGCIAAMSSRPTYAVWPGIPSTPRYADRVGAAFGSILRAPEAFMIA